MAHLENGINKKKLQKFCNAIMLQGWKRWQIENTEEKLDKIRVVGAEIWKDKTDASCQ